MKLSIITVNYNNANDLVRTIKSVREQTWKDFEYLVIDGGSTDGSIEVLRQYQDKINYWVSEPDNGIFHAMNKGIKEARGEYLLMLNAGDVLSSNDILNKVFGKKDVNEDIIYGDVLRESKGKIFTESKFPDQLTFFFLRNGAISHQAAFISRKLHDIVGLYDEKLKLSSDWSFILLAICKYSASYKHLHNHISICNADGLTCLPSNASVIKKEREHVLNTHFSAFLNDYQFIDKIIGRRISKRVQGLSRNLLSKCKLILKLVLIR